MGDLRRTAFFVPGTPLTKGSWKGVLNKQTMKIRFKPQTKEPTWAATVKVFAAQAHEGAPWECPCRAFLSFSFSRPKVHFGKGRNAGVLKPSAPLLHAQMPDIDKLTRSVLDAMTKIVYKDDSQIIRVDACKDWCYEGPGVQIEVVEAGRLRAAIDRAMESDHG